MDDLDEIVAEFIVESHENLDQLDRDLVALEQGAGSPELLASIFRTVHTIKGTSGLLSFSRLESVTHAGENLLSLLRDGKLVLDEDRTAALQDLVDAVRDVLTSIERTGTEGHRDLSGLVDRLRSLQSGPVPRRAAARHDGSDEGEPAGPLIGDLLVAQGVVTEEDVADALLMQQRGDTRRLGEILVEKGRARAAATEAAAASQAETRRSIAASTIRVDVGLLDSLMQVVDELLSIRDELLAQGVAAPALRLDGIAERLRVGVARTRLQPIETVWNRLPRIVRELSHACGRQVRLEMLGRQTELDKTILEAVRDPITHLVRNAVDHGIEPPAARRAAGKRPEGTLLLRAVADPGQVTIEVRDDGRGIDPDVVAARAVARGVVTAAQVARMTRADVLGLVFAPGVTTAQAVTNVSGRGVGMDVVRTNVERIGGTVTLASEPGLGTTVRMTIPLSPTRTPALV